jgi:oxygen-independent coproporphyrinogen-3 oxidase
MIRRHILNLMCTGRTDWDTPLSGNDELIAGLERAKLLEQDGLVEILENRLVVTPLGKRFLRNICMTLDVRLWSEQPETQLFSMAG